ncbi:MAG: DNA methyltransferase [Patescibacteria group bacterium]
MNSPRCCGDTPLFHGAEADGKGASLCWDPAKIGLEEICSYGPTGESLLIMGENFAVMRSLLPAWAGRVRMIYIDPPFNTGKSFHYQDDFEHAAWLRMMEERLPLLRDFLRLDGTVFVHLDDVEMAYCKVAMDRIFGRDCYVTTIVVQSATPSSFKTVNPGPVDVTEYILMYCRARASFRCEPQFLPRDGVDLKRFSHYIANPADPPEVWRFETVAGAALREMGFASQRDAERALGAEIARGRLRAAAEAFALANAERVFETKTLQRPGRRLAEAIARSREIPGVLMVARKDRPDLYLHRGRQLYFLARGVREIGGRRVVVGPLSNLWTDISTSGLFSEGGVDFRYGKKPEKLLARLIAMATDPGDWVMDAFAGSGTTGAVAAKLGRRWLMIESGPQAETHALPRLRRVVEGGDTSGIGPAEEGRAGGFTYYRAAAPAGPGASAPIACQPEPERGAHPVLVAAAVVQEGGCYLVAQRADSLLWEFPGGKVEAGEDVREALRREILEELGLEISVDEPLEAVAVREPRDYVILFFRARILTGEPRKLDCLDFRWVEGRGLARLPMGKADRRMAKLLEG